MFILRRITSDGRESNTILGETYHLIDKEISPEDFGETKKRCDPDEEGVYAYIGYGNGESLMAMYKPSHYYIMTSNGKTFANLTRR
jgi:hypothetical protein